ncbi:hypothetical protein [Microbacterium sp. Yaish 1]|uniref:hypothetical protein n=1 Tax=Microbacterium sp. Yaish 1 TaxID=2025014 RepID=UPI000B941510|nr:hypothetical protein [Microbacterium sp. Yaish 1]OYC98010.1 hypothetical protein CI089_05700 [Microbacterium sp. Yaish 1]
MNPRIAVAGDRPEPMAAAIASLATAGEPTCLVWTVDLEAEPTARRSRVELKQRYDSLLAHASGLAALRNLVVLLRHADRVPERKMHAAAAALATRLHADLERARGRYVDVAVVDISSCTDTRRLLDRVEEVAGTAAGPVGNVALTWHEIRDRSIHAAAAASQF